MVNMYELKPHDGRESFYGKAHVVMDGTGDIYLYSYCTAVAVIHDHELHRLWGDWSATTGRHIKAFCAECRIPEIRKADWDKLDIEVNWPCPINA